MWFGPSRDHHGGFIHHWDITTGRDRVRSHECFAFVLYCFSCAQGILGEKKIQELHEMSADKVKKYVHTDHVMDLCGITGMDILVSAGMDKRIGMWDIKANQVMAMHDPKAALCNTA